MFRGLVLLLALVVTIPAAAWGGGHRSVHLRLKWRHQFQSAGYYVAIQKGFYRAKDLEVIISEPNPEEDAVNMVLSGQVEFAVATSGLVIHRMKGRSVVALAAIFQQSPLWLITRDDKRFDTPAGLRGAKVMIEPDSEEVAAFLSRHQLLPEDLTRLEHKSPVAAFASKEIDAFTAYATDELFALNKAGLLYRRIPLGTPDLDYYSDVLFTSQEVVDQDPAAVRAFRSASLKGWEYAFDHVEETIKLIEERYGVTKGRDALAFEAEEMLKHARPSKRIFGQMNDHQWKRIADAYASDKIAPPARTIDGFTFGGSYRSRGKTWVAILVGVGIVVSLALFTYASDLAAAFARRKFEKVPPPPLPNPAA